MSILKIKRATIENLEDITAISRRTWDGDDYLEEKAPGWIKDGSLYAGEFDGRIVGTFRLSHMPEGVLWLEGLRIHPEYTGHGYGRQMADTAFETGNRIIADGQAECMEFSTYINNHESIHISKSQGFRVVNRYILMSKEGIDSDAEIERIEPSHSVFTDLTDHIPCGWKYPRLCSEGIEWALQRSDVYRTGNSCFLRRTDSDETTPLSGAFENPDSFFEGAEAVAKSAGNSHSCIVLHESAKDMIKIAFNRGYGTWEPVNGYNVLIFRYNK